MRAAGGSGDRVFALPDGLSYEKATFLPLANGGLTWSRATPIQPGDTVVVLGQGLVGNLYAQAVRARNPGRVIVVDATPLRCSIAANCGADTVLNAAEIDTVAAIKEQTDGRGADVVIQVANNAAVPEGLTLLRDGGQFLDIGAGGKGSIPVEQMPQQMTYYTIRSGAPRHWLQA